MKTLFVLLSGVFFLVSCAPSLRIVETDDPEKGIKSTRFQFAPESYSEVKEGEWIGRTHYNLKSAYLYLAEGSGRPLVTVDFRMVVPVETDELDSVMFFNLDNEMIRIVSDQHKEADSLAAAGKKSAVKNEKAENQGQIGSTATPNKSYRLISREFLIPENLWISIANSETIKCRLYLGKTGVEVKLKGEETKKLKHFFSLAASKLETDFPAIPEGQKKW